MRREGAVGYMAASGRHAEMVAATMRAAVYSRVGPAREVLSVAERPRPVPAEGEVRVRLAWSGVNPSDVKSRAGTRTRVLPFPEITPHSDGAGEIDAVGPGVDRQRIGERVWVWNGGWARAQGTAAQWIVLPTSQVVRLPDNVPLEVGACLGIPALTAAHAVRMHGGVAGQSVLVAGGAGAVGHYAIQMAKLSGARQVIATVSNEDKARLARTAGADAVIDYRREDVAARVRELANGNGVDRIVEVDFAANASMDFASIARGGRIVVYGSGAPEIPVPFVPAILANVELSFFIVYHLAEPDRARAVGQVTHWLASNALQHNIAARMPLAMIADAHEAVESGRATGNVLLDVASA